MAIGNFISASDYNAIRNKIINVVGPGAGNSGYGQTLQSSAVATGNVVTKAQWDALRFDIYNALFHQTGSVPIITQVSTSDVIRYGAANPNFQYDTLADTAIANRFNLGAGRFVTENKGTNSTSVSWSASQSCTLTVTFGTANDARYFFNSGGKIRFTSSRTGGSSTAQNSSWSNLLTTVGTQAFGGNSPSVNFYSLTNSYQTFYTLTASSPYASNVYRLEALSNVADNSTGTANILTFRITWTDAYVDPDVLAGRPPTLNPPGDVVDGTLSLNVDQIRPVGTLQPSGTFTITGPSLYSFSSFSGS